MAQDRSAQGTKGDSCEAPRGGKGGTQQAQGSVWRGSMLSPQQTEKDRKTALLWGQRNTDAQHDQGQTNCPVTHTPWGQSSQLGGPPSPRSPERETHARYLHIFQANGDVLRIPFCILFSLILYFDLILEITNQYVTTLSHLERRDGGYLFFVYNCLLFYTTLLNTTLLVDNLSCVIFLIFAYLIDVDGHYRVILFCTYFGSNWASFWVSKSPLPLVVCSHPFSIGLLVFYCWEEPNV